MFSKQCDHVYYLKHKFVVVFMFASFVIVSFTRLFCREYPPSSDGDN